MAKAKQKPKTQKPVAKTTPAQSETDDQQSAVIAKLVAEHGLSYDAASKIVKASRPSTKALPTITTDDDHVKTVPVNFHPRAGVSLYRAELQERLQDIEETKHRVFYVLPVRLTKKLYKFLLQDTLREDAGEPYTEENHIETVLLERMAIVGLTSGDETE